MTCDMLKYHKTHQILKQILQRDDFISSLCPVSPTKVLRYVSEIRPFHVCFPSLVKNVALNCAWPRPGCLISQRSSKGHDIYSLNHAHNPFPYRFIWQMVIIHDCGRCRYKHLLQFRYFWDLSVELSTWLILVYVLVFTFMVFPLGL